MKTFGLFKKESKGKQLMQTFEEVQRNSMDLTWNNFWGSYDGLLEIALLRQSCHLCDGHSEIVEKMFDDCLVRLRDNLNSLINNRNIKTNAF